jgi:hypothetical protein
MGSFINSQADNEICEVLNKRFSDDVNPLDGQGRTYLEEIRDFFQHKENLFDANHSLHRVFHRLAKSVTTTTVPKHPQSRKRWLHLLHGNLPAAVDKAIRDQLTAILSPASAASKPSKVKYVTFLTRHVATSTGDQFELYPKNGATPSDYKDANGTPYCKIALECNIDKQLDDNSTEQDPPQDPGGETVIPNYPSARRKSAAKKYSAKKSAKKNKPAKKKKSTKKK